MHRALQLLELALVAVPAVVVGDERLDIHRFAVRAGDQGQTERPARNLVEGRLRLIVAGFPVGREAAFPDIGA